MKLDKTTVRSNSAAAIGDVHVESGSAAMCDSLISSNVVETGAGASEPPQRDRPPERFRRAPIAP